MCLGIPGQVVALDDAGNSMATVLVAGVERRINLTLLEPGSVSAGDWVLVHAGMALSRLEDEEARQLLAVLQEMSEVFAEQEGVAAPEL